VNELTSVPSEDERLVFELLRDGLLGEFQLTRRAKGIIFLSATPGGGRMDLCLTNGTSIVDADRKLSRFMGAEYELYDGIRVPEDSTLSLFDILLSIMMNSRLDTADKVRSIWKGKAPVEKTLRIEIDDEAFARVYGHKSHPIEVKGPGQKIAVRVISQFGEECTKVLEVT